MASWGTEGFLTEERKNQVWALAAIWTRVGRVQGWEDEGQSEVKAMVALAQMVTLGMDPRLFIKWTGPNYMEPKQKKDNSQI